MYAAALPACDLTPCIGQHRLGEQPVLCVE